MAMNPAQVLQGSDVIALIGMIIIVQVPQVNAFVHVQYLNL